MINSKYNIIKLGVDVHAKSYTLVRQIDGATPQPAQRFSPEKFIEFVKKQQQLAQEVYTCYEAGPFGFVLHRNLSEMGVINLVVAPKKWNDHGDNVKTDKRDAWALCDRLDRYINGNKKAFSIVRVPTEQQERERVLSRQRLQMQKSRLRIQAQGRSLMLQNGIQKTGRWWKPRSWFVLKESLPQWMIDILEAYRNAIIPIAQEEERLAKELSDLGYRSDLVYGLGGLSCEQLRREVLDWNRFNNRREVSSFTGLCPSESSSGPNRRQGSINKHGNPTIRATLVEISWRLCRRQPDYPPIAKRMDVLYSKKSAAKKKAIVAVSRILAVDLWRIFTKQTTAKKVGLLLKSDINMMKLEQSLNQGKCN
jgi:transposase